MAEKEKIKEKDVLSKMSSEYGIPESEAKEALETEFVKGFCLSRPSFVWGKLGVVCRAFKETHT